MGESTPDPLRYRLLTGGDDRAFCERVSQALDDGYRLYGSPSIAVRGGETITAQAVTLDEGNGKPPVSVGGNRG